MAKSGSGGEVVEHAGAGCGCWCGELKGELRLLAGGLRGLAGLGGGVFALAGGIDADAGEEAGGVNAKEFGNIAEKLPLLAVFAD